MQHNDNNDNNNNNNDWKCCTIYYKQTKPPTILLGVKKYSLAKESIYISSDEESTLPPTPPKPNINPSTSSSENLNTIPSPEPNIITTNPIITENLTPIQPTKKSQTKPKKKIKKSKKKKTKKAPLVETDETTDEEIEQPKKKVKSDQEIFVNYLITKLKEANCLGLSNPGYLISKLLHNYNADNFLTDFVNKENDFINSIMHFKEDVFVKKNLISVWIHNNKSERLFKELNMEKRKWNENIIKGCIYYHFPCLIFMDALNLKKIGESFKKVNEIMGEDELFEHEMRNIGIWTELKNVIDSKQQDYYINNEYFIEQEYCVDCKGQIEDPEEKRICYKCQVNTIHEQCEYGESKVIKVAQKSFRVCNECK